MGADYSAYAIVGARVPTEKLRRKTKVRGCSHYGGDANQPLPAGTKFCPECGSPAWVESVEYVLDPEGFHDMGSKAKSEFRAVGSTDNQSYYFTLTRLLPRSFRERPNSNGGPFDGYIPLSPEDVLDAKERLRFLLEPLGLWEDGAFGLWTVLYCSC